MRVIPIAAGIVVAMSVAPMGLDSCGIGLPEPVLVARRGPADPRAAFLKGKVGVIQSTYDQRSLIAAYRVLSGSPLSEAEFDEFFPPPTSEGFVNPYNNAALDFWNQTRGRVRVDVGGSISPHKSVQAEGQYYYFRNCLDDAFLSASRTLEDRAGVWGWDDQRIRDWVTAQQQVFTHCSGNQAVTPAPPDDQMDRLLAADRRYQLAAVHFYDGEWQKARTAFEQIANDKDSPWRGIAPYLIARAYVREGSITEKKEVLREAEKQLTAIIADPKQSEWRDASTAMLDYVRLRIDPYTRMAKLASTLMRPGEEDDVNQALTDFIYLFNRFSDWRADTAPMAASSDLADWLLTMQRGSKEEHVVARWKATHNPAWLIAALQVSTDEKELPALLNAARQVKPTAPEYESLMYLGLIRYVVSGKQEEARVWADSALRRPMLVSSRNLILGERLKLARNWSEFLRYAPRRPEPHLEMFDNHELPAKAPPTPSGTAPLFDWDVIEIMNAQVPLSLWIDASRNALTPVHLQLQIAQSAWMRAVLLDRHAEARQLIERVVQIQPAFANATREYLAAADPVAHKRAALLLILRTPGLDPDLNPLDGVPVNLASSKRTGGGCWGFVKTTGSTPRATSFLTSAQREQNEGEHDRLAKTAPFGATYLAEEAVKWAQSLPSDERVPEVLHLAVQATRFGMKDERTGEFSRQAFTLLHKNYPQSEWAKKTKYWFK